MRNRFVYALVCVLLFNGVVREAGAQEKRKPRAARSVHLAYEAPDGISFYNEVKVVKSAKATYFSVCGFRHGYFGMQELWNGKKVVIFSIWDPGKQDNPNIVKKEDRVKVLHEGKDVKVSRFGGEGTGGKSMYDYDWKVGKTYRFMVKVKVKDGRSAYSGYFYEPKKKAWKHLVTFEVYTGGDYLKGYYSFVEDFRRNGESVTWKRRADFLNGWVQTKDGKWVSLNKARFTGDPTPLDNIDAGPKQDGFFLATGGEIKNKTVKLWGKMERKPSKRKGLEQKVSLDAGKKTSEKSEKNSEKAFWAKVKKINPSPSTPVRDDVEKDLLKREMQLIARLPVGEVTAHRTAEAVYGKITKNAKKLRNHSVEIDTNKTGWLATGMYAIPGEKVILRFPKSLVGKGYWVRVNGHVDNISKRKRWDRMPHGISRRFAINSKKVEVANAFGGPIYIDVGGTAGGKALGLGNVKIMIERAIEAPMFILGQTTNAQWVAGIREYEGPYAEFVCDNLAFSVPSKWIRNLENPERLMKYWNDVVAYQDWVGGHEDLRTGPERINVDVQISVGLLHAGYPIQGPTTASKGLVDYDKLAAGGNWGYFHELGHEMQRRPDKRYRGWRNLYTFNGDVEVTVNIFSNIALEKMAPGAPKSGWGWSAYPDEVMKRGIKSVAKGGNFDSKNPYPYYFQLADCLGWETYRAVLQGYNHDQLNNPSALPKTNEQKKDQWLIRFSKASGYDLRSYMVKTWGLTVSDAANKTMDTLNLPDWMPAMGGVVVGSFEKNVAEKIDVVSVALSYDGVAKLTAVSDGANGKVINNGDGTLTYTPNADFRGEDEFTYTIASSTGAKFTTKLKVTLR